jgi:hypothetical protein
MSLVHINQVIATKQMSLQVSVHVFTGFYYIQWMIHDWSNKYCDMWKNDEMNHNSLKWNPFSIQDISSIQTRMLIITVRTVIDHSID